MPDMEKNLEIKKYEKFRKARFVGFLAFLGVRCPITAKILKFSEKPLNFYKIKQ